MKVDRGHIVVDEWLRTGEPGVYAIGDVVGTAMAGPQGGATKGSSASKSIAGLKNVHPLDTANIPGCTYCMPQVASVGLTEQAAKEPRIARSEVGRFPYHGQRQGYRDG